MSKIRFVCIQKVFKVTSNFSQSFWEINSLVKMVFNFITRLVVVCPSHKNELSRELSVNINLFCVFSLLEYKFDLFWIQIDPLLNLLNQKNFVSVLNIIYWWIVSTEYSVKSIFCLLSMQLEIVVHLKEAWVDLIPRYSYLRVQ